MAERGMTDREGGSKSKTSPRSGCKTGGREHLVSGPTPARDGSPQSYSIQQYNFQIEGPLYGYRASVAKAFDPKYANFKRMVRLLANVAGVPSELGPMDDAELFLHVYWAKKARIDTSNVLKAVEDGVFKQDRRVSGIHASRHEHSGSERVEVFLTIGRGYEAKKDSPEGGGRRDVAPAQDGTSAAC